MDNFMVNAKNLRWLLMIWILTLMACSTPAYKNTWYSSDSSEVVLVRAYKLGTYELDGYLIDVEGLAHQIKSLVESRRLQRMMVEPMEEVSLINQAAALQIGEKNGLETYRVGFIGSQKMTSKQLLTQRDEKIKYDDRDLLEEIDRLIDN